MLTKITLDINNECYKESVLNDYMLEQVALLYYQNDMSQQEVAEYLNISKMNVSRMLQKAKDTKIVHTTVKLPFKEQEALARKLERLFDLEQATVVRPPTGKQAMPIRDFLGGVTAFYLMLEVPKDTVYGMGVGETVGKVVENIMPIKTQNVHVVQLMGGLATVSRGNPFSIIQETCSKLSSNGTYLTSYAIVDDAQSCERILSNDIHTNGVYDLWAACDEAYFGIGCRETGTFFAESLRNTADLESINEQGTIGDILGHCFNADGTFLKTVIEDRLVSIPVEMLRNVKKRVAISGGVEKAPAILGALRSGMITHLVTDEDTAEQIIHLQQH